jgi:hypothetical protein
MNEPEPFELEVTSETFSVKVKGFRPLAQVSQYVADAVGLLGEPIGTAKDALTRFRVHRAESAAIALQRAKEIAEEEGKKPAEITRSPKFIAPWIEGASTEDCSDENILDLWARILVSAPENYSSTHAALIEVLRRIGPKEAKIMRSIVHLDSYQGVRSSIDGPAFRKYLSLDGAQMQSVRIIEGMTKLAKRFNLEGLLGRPNGNCLENLSRRIVGTAISISFRRNGGGGGISRFKEEFEVLEFSGAITKRRKVIELDNDSRIEVVWAEPTAIGLRLFETINAKELIITDGSLDFYFAKPKRRSR